MSQFARVDQSALNRSLNRTRGNIRVDVAEPLMVCFVSRGPGVNRPSKAATYLRLTNEYAGEEFEAKW